MATAPQIVGESMSGYLQVPDVKCFKIEGGTKKQLGTGQLNVLDIGSDTLMLFIHGVMQYAINKSFPSLRASEYSFVFPSANHVCFGLVFPDSISKDDLEMFEGLLTQYSQFQVQATDDDDDGGDDDNDGDGDDTTSDTAVASNSNDRLVRYGLKAAEYLKKGTVVAQKGIQKGTVIAAKGIRRARDVAKKKNHKTRRERGF